MGTYFPSYLKYTLQHLPHHTDHPALENTTLSDLVAMDNTYLPRLRIRRQLVQDHRREIIACNPEAIPAVMELYEWLIGTYLPRRFPTLYPRSSTLHNISHDPPNPQFHHR